MLKGNNLHFAGNLPLNEFATQNFNRNKLFSRLKMFSKKKSSVPFENKWK